MYYNVLQFEQTVFTWKVMKGIFFSEILVSEILVWDFFRWKIGWPYNDRLEFIVTSWGGHHSQKIHDVQWLIKYDEMCL